MPPIQSGILKASQISVPAPSATVPAPSQGETPVPPGIVWVEWGIFFHPFFIFCFTPLIIFCFI
jgi:hypothetical protein